MNTNQNYIKAILEGAMSVLLEKKIKRRNIFKGGGTGIRMGRDYIFWGRKGQVSMGGGWGCPSPHIGKPC